MLIKVAIVYEGDYEIVETTEEQVAESIDVNMMSLRCISKERNLYVAYGDEHFYENDSQDYQYVIKANCSDAVCVEQMKIESLTEEDIAFVDRRHGAIFSVYSYWAISAISFFVSYLSQNKKYQDDKNKELEEVYDGYSDIKTYYENLMGEARR